MRKIVILLLFVCLLCGCGAVEEKPVHPVVTSITVTRQEGSLEEVLEFPSDKETTQVLNYLRNITYCGRALVNPAYVAGPMYTFCLYFSDGSKQTMQQKGERYFLGTDGVWKEIEPYSGSRLTRLLPP